MGKKDQKKENKEDDALMAKGQIVRLKKLFSMQSGAQSNAVNPNKLN